jgi:hypothetical protein
LREAVSYVAIHVLKTAWIAAPLAGARNDEWEEDHNDERKTRKIINNGYK